MPQYTFECLHGFKIMRYGAWEMNQLLIWTEKAGIVRTDMCLFLPHCYILRTLKYDWWTKTRNAKWMPPFWKLIQYYNCLKPFLVKSINKTWNDLFMVSDKKRSRVTKSNIQGNDLPRRTAEASVQLSRFQHKNIEIQAIYLEFVTVVVGMRTASRGSYIWTFI